MTVWVLSDLHLSLSIPKKNMEVFGLPWRDYMNRIKENWEKRVSVDDLVLIPGDICWATTLEEAVIDLDWIDQLPGTKVLLKGNHDYWWPSTSKLKAALPPSIHFVYNDVFNWNDVSIGGARLWDSPEYHFDAIIHRVENPFAKKKTEAEIEKQKKDAVKIFDRELERLKLSLSKLNQKSRFRIAMTHYPPIGNDLKGSRASKIFETYNVDIVTFGHLHNVKKGISLFGEKNGVQYVFASADYLEFDPLTLVNT
jgi:uncharacterized protein